MSKMILFAALFAVVSVAAAEEPHASCVKALERQRECKDLFLPALVDLRITLDKPKGIAASAKKEGRQSLLAMAQKEYETDSTDAAISAMCAKMSGSPTFVASMNKCTEATTCEAFTECAIPLMGKKIK